MDLAELLTDTFDRIAELYDGVADGLGEQELGHRPGGTGNPIGWLLWHLARVQDDHIAGITGGRQAWEDWRQRFDLPLEPYDHGYGHSSLQVDTVRIHDVSLLTGYHADVHRLTLDYVRTADGAELDRVVDDAWDPPVTAGVRLVSIAGDCLQHLGQAAYVRGLLDR